MNDGLCRYFDNKDSLDKHYQKNPSHRNVSFSKCKEEAARRIHLRTSSYSNKISTPKVSSSSTSSRKSKGWLFFLTLLRLGAKA